MERVKNKFDAKANEKNVSYKNSLIKCVDRGVLQ